MMGYGAGLGFGLGGCLTLVGCVLLFVGAVALIAWAIGKVTHPSQGPQTQAARTASGEALELLGVRFAKGEITAEEYKTSRQTLEAGR